ncbi:hypothetical protein [Phycicoccus flavus]|uniref:hypothetical protein n=1 Tax=Phycicoccus flavus TaxID=2502783 RepID=UPI000FEB637E|nr:hypothetical protein [Phycicoccus flavus]NHA68436.1 hypothetical protein [Phycicoccus flavus]
MRTTTLRGGWADTRAAEHALARSEAGHDDGVSLLGDPAVGAYTVFVPGDDDSPPQVAVVVAASPKDAPAGARAFRFPGHETLVGAMTVGELLERSSIGRVLDLTGAPVDPRTSVDTQDFVRPTVQDGVLTLVVRPGVHGVLPFEQPHPTPCCADHDG